MTAEEVAKNRLTRVSCEDLLTAETQSSQRFFYSLFSATLAVVRKNRFFLILIDPVQRCFFHSEKFTVRSGY
jgi:hypothetical protein